MSKKIGNTVPTFWINGQEVDYLLNDGAVKIERPDAEKAIKGIYSSILKSKGYKKFNLVFV